MRDHGTLHGSASGPIRNVKATDVAALERLIGETGLFPPELLPDMLAPYLSEESDDYWLTYEERGLPIAVAFCARERMTDGTWNLYLIAVHPDYQGAGRGSALLRSVEGLLTARGERMLLVETSGLPEFEGTRAFYRRCGYEEEARIREFYKAGEDKIVFRRRLPAPA